MTSGVRTPIPYGRQWLDEDEIEAVCRVLRSDWITQGPTIQAFEEAMASRCGARYAVAVATGTAALHCACFAAGIGPGDEVVTSPLTFVASANAVLYLGGRPVFADVEEDTGLIEPDEIERRITPRTKAIIPVDFAGHPTNLDAIKDIASRHRLMVIEDGAHALGATYKGCRVGTLADATIFSFHPVKHITTGEGGMVLTDDPELCDRLRRFRNHGITRNPVQFESRDLAFAADDAGHDPNPWYYEMRDLGFNYRITDFQSALGLVQLRKLDAFLKRRREIVFAYTRAFTELEGVRVPIEREYAESAWHLYVLKCDREVLRVSRGEIFRALRAAGLGVNVHYIPVYYHPYYRRLGYRLGECPRAERYYDEAISLPLFPRMTDAEVEFVIAAVGKVVEQVRGHARG